MLHPDFLTGFCQMVIALEWRQGWQKLARLESEPSLPNTTESHKLESAGSKTRQNITYDLRLFSRLLNSNRNKQYK
jgi:hypothetical protein